MKQKTSIIQALIIIVFLSLTIIPLPAFSREWNDLHKEDAHIFGSEKEKKYNPDMFFLQRESWDNHYSFMFFWLFKYTDYPSYKSIRILPFYYGLQSKKDNRSLSFIPIALTYWEHDEDSYYKEDFKINPLFVSGNIKYNDNTTEIYTLSLFHGYSFYNKATFKEPEKTWWAPIIPLIFRSTDQNGGHMNILWLMDYSWHKDSSGNDVLNDFWFFPLILHQVGDNGYTHILPPIFLYNRHSNGEYWLSLFPIFKRSLDREFSYHNKQTSDIYTDSFRSLLFCYNSSYSDINKINKIKSEYWAPIIPLFYSSLEEDEETLLFFPLYYYHNSLESGGYFARVINPIYWNIKTSKRNSTLFLPLYFETTKKDGSGSTYINILGYSRSIASGINPVIDTSLGINNRGIYMDIDISWLIDMVSLSSRVTVPMTRDEESKFKSEIATGEITLSKDPSVSRENSLNFWGFHLLYGLVAFEKADTKRHLRILPLSWLTWDSESDNRLKVILNYISYKDDESEYIVFFPFYGYQKIASSYKKGFMLNCLWIEYDHEKNMKEYTILWPFINWYSSPDKSGYRIIPLIWHKEKIEGDVIYSSTYTTLFIDREEKKVTDNQISQRLTISLLHYYHLKSDASYSSTTWFSIIPLLYHNEETINSTYEIPLATEIKETKETKKKKPAENLTVIKKYRVEETKTTDWLLPFYISFKNKTRDEGNNSITTTYTLYGLPLLYYNSTEDSYLKENRSQQKSEIFLLGYYQKKSDSMVNKSFLFGLWEYSNYYESKDYSFSLLYSLINVSNINGNFTNRAIPLYIYNSNKDSFDFSLLLGLTSFSKNSLKGDSSFSLFYWIYNNSISHFKYHYSYNKTYSVSDASESELWLVPFFYYSKIEPDKSDFEFSETLTVSPLHYHFTHYNNNSPIEKTFWIPIVPLFYKHSDESSTHWNILWLLDYGYDQLDKSTRIWFLPFIFSKTGDNGYFHIAPIFFYDWNNKENESTKFILGLYLKNAQNYSRENFLYLYDHIKDSANDKEEFSLAFKTLKLEIHPEVKRFCALWGFLTDLQWSSNSYEFNALFYLAGITSRENYYKNKFIPFWYYESFEDSYTLIIPPLLTWDSKDNDDSRLQAWALGAIWFRNYEPKEHSDIQALLLGIPYYKIQRPERGYQSFGSLWGLLWQYETESETNFSKLSILKFIYKRVEINDKVEHRILGISF